MTERKRELWEKDKNVFQRMKINASLWFMKFQRNTHGFGLFMILMFIMMSVFMLYNIFMLITEETERNKIIRENECRKAGGCYNAI